MKRFTRLVLASTALALSLSAVAGATDYSGGYCTSPKPRNVSQSYYNSYCAVYGPNGSYSQQQTSAGNTGGSSSTGTYCYPNGSYWAQQRALYPAYYQANDGFYTKAYSCK